MPVSYFMFFISLSLYLMIIIMIIRLKNQESTIIKGVHLWFIMGITTIFSGNIITDILITHQWGRGKISVESDVYYVYNILFIIGEAMTFFGLKQYVKNQNKGNIYIENLCETSKQGYNVVINNEISTKNQYTESIFYFDVSKMNLQLNNKALELIGYSIEALSYIHLIDIIDSESQEKIKNFVTKAKKSSIMYSIVNVTKMDGNQINLAVMIDLKVDSGKKYIKGISRDATENEKTKRELIKAKEEAVIANMAKAEFLANMSHEIRTPMNGILGLTNILLQSELKERERGIMENIKKSADSLLYIINDILDFSKIESGKFEINKEIFDLYNLVNDIKEIFKINQQEKKLSIKYEIGNNIPTWLLGDKLRLKQILINLIGNAIKFTPKGNVTVRVITIDKNVVFEDNKEIQLQFEVEDTGIGISKEYLEDVFESFKQIESTYQRKYNGTGLGLTITKQLVEIMGGIIHVKSKVEEGSTFIFQIPFVIIDENTLKQKENCETRLSKSKIIVKEDKNCTENLSGNILVAEDNSVNQMLVRELITMNGWDCKLVENGKEVLEALEEKKYDLILMDISMPIMDGITATKIIRNDPRWCHMPIVALTAYALVADRENFIAQGVDDYLSKPLEQKEFYSVISKYLSLPTKRNEGSKKKDKDDIYNFKKLEGLLDGDSRLIVELGEKIIQMFSEVEIIKIENLIKGNERLELKEYVHKVKGAVSNFDLSEVQNCLKELYESASCGKTIEAISKIDEIRSEMKEFEGSLEIYRDKSLFLAKNHILKD